MVLADAPVRPLLEPPPQTPPATSLRGGRRSTPERTRAWVRFGLFGAALITAFGGLTSVIQGWGWYAAVVGTLLVPLIAIALATHFSRREWVPPVVGVAVGVALLAVVFAPMESFLGVVPTADTFARWGELVATGGDSIARQFVPAIPREGIQFILAVLAVASVVTIAPIVNRVPAVAALPLLIVLDIPVAVREGLLDPFWFILTAVLYLVLLRVGRRRMPAGSAAGAGAVLIVASLVIPNWLPQPVERITGATGFGAGVNPLIDLGADLRRGDPITAVTYTTDAPTGLYLRLATLVRFDGITWNPDDAIVDDEDVTELPAPVGLADRIPRTEYSANVVVGDIGGRWAPVPYPATGIRGGDGDWRFEPEGLTLRSGSSINGAEYSVDFLDVEPDLEQLAAVPRPDVDGRYLAVPFLPEIVRQTALQVAGEGTPYERALALQAFFTQTDFVYSLDAPVEEGYDGTGVGVIADFLEKRSGYCVHFASSMAVMARVVGIPARVVVGFQPGTSQLLDGERVYTATSDDLHAWPELYFENVGWVRFEPTPGRGTIPDYSTPEAIDDPLTPEDEGAEPEPEPTTAPTIGPRPIDDLDDGGSDGGSVSTSATPWVTLVSLLGAVVVILLAPAGVRRVIRWRRLRRVRAGDAAAAWAEVRDTAIDHDWIAPESETPRRLGERLAIVVGAAAVEPLQRGVEASAYDRPGSGRLSADDVEHLIGAISSSAALGVRVRAVLLPPSLLRRLGVGTGPEA